VTALLQPILTVKLVTRQGLAVADKPARRAASRQNVLQTNQVDAQCDKLATIGKPVGALYRMDSWSIEPVKMLLILV